MEGPLNLQHSMPPRTAGQYSRRPIKSKLFIMKAMASLLKQRGPTFGSTQGQSPVQGDFLLLAKEQQCWRSQDLLVGSTISILLHALTTAAPPISMSTMDTRRNHTVEMSSSNTSIATLKNNPGHRRQRKDSGLWRRGRSGGKTS